jgi:hypothetical protein
MIAGKLKLPCIIHAEWNCSRLHILSRLCLIAAMQNFHRSWIAFRRMKISLPREMCCRRIDNTSGWQFAELFFNFGQLLD